MSGAPPSWDEVLAGVEADALRAETMLRSAASGTDPVDPSWAQPIAETVLPPLAAMPAIPAQLRGRIEQLREQIDALSAELAGVLREWPGATSALGTRRPLAPAAPAHPEPSRYVDRRI